MHRFRTPFQGVPTLLAALVIGVMAARPATAAPQPTDAGRPKATPPPTQAAPRPTQPPAASVAPASAPAAPAPAAPATAADAPKGGPIEQLVTASKFADAITKVEELRAKSPTHLADSESEFWAAKAELGLKNQTEAKERFLSIVKNQSDSPRAGEAAVEAAIIPLRDLEGEAKTEDDKKAAISAAKELETVGARFPKDEQQAPRAYYIAGNARRMAEDVQGAEADWEIVRKNYTKTDYPGKAMHMLAVYALRDFNPDRARSIYSECIARLTEPASTARCRKSLDRVAIIGEQAPPLKIETWLNSPAIELESLRGNVVLLWFFATWCPHCKAEMPKIAELHGRFKDKKLKIIAITFNSKDQTTETAKVFVEQPEWKIDYPAAVDLGGQTSEAYQSTGVPAAVLIDKKGVIRWADHPTYLVDQMVDRLLAE